MPVRMIKFLEKKFTLPLLLATLFFTAYSLHSINRHLTFNSHAFDLGIYSQITYLYSQGLTPYSSLKHMLLLADHFGVILFLISPVYKIFPSPMTLLIIQALCVSLSSIPLYLIAKDKLKSTLISLLLSLSYLTSVALISAISFDFHLATISVLPLSLILYFWYFKKIKLYWFFLIFSLLFKEDVPLFILGLGIYQIITKQFRLGLLTSLFALISLYVIKFQIMPFLWSGGESSYLSTSLLPLDSPLDLITLLILKPSIFLDIFLNSSIKLNTFHTLLREFGYLPLLSPFYWLTAFPHLYLRFSSSYVQSWTLTFHHNANILPFLFISAVMTISSFNLPKKYIVTLLLITLLLGGLSPNAFIYHNFKVSNTEKYNLIKRHLNSLPEKASISAQSSLVPHLANRERIYLFPEIYDAEYIILDTKLSSYPIQSKILKQKIAILKSLNDWEVIKQEGSLIIFKKSGIYDED